MGRERAWADGGECEAGRKGDWELGERTSCEPASVSTCAPVREVYMQAADPPPPSPPCPFPPLPDPPPWTTTTGPSPSIPSRLESERQRRTTVSLQTLPTLPSSQTRPPTTSTQVSYSTPPHLIGRTPSTSASHLPASPSRPLPLPVPQAETIRLACPQKTRRYHRPLSHHVPPLLRPTAPLGQNVLV